MNAADITADIDRAEAFGPAFLRVRKHLGLTLTTLAARSELSASYLSEMERGLRPPPRDDRVRRLSEALGVPSAADALCSLAWRTRSSAASERARAKDVGKPKDAPPGIDDVAHAFHEALGASVAADVSLSADQHGSMSESLELDRAAQVRPAAPATLPAGYPPALLIPTSGLSPEVRHLLTWMSRVAPSMTPEQAVLVGRTVAAMLGMGVPPTGAYARRPPAEVPRSGKSEIRATEQGASVPAPSAQEKRGAESAAHANERAADDGRSGEEIRDLKAGSSERPAESGTPPWKDDALGVAASDRTSSPSQVATVALGRSSSSQAVAAKLIPSYVPPSQGVVQQTKRKVRVIGSRSEVVRLRGAAKKAAQAWEDPEGTKTLIEARDVVHESGPYDPKTVRVPGMAHWSHRCDTCGHVKRECKCVCDCGRVNKHLCLYPPMGSVRGTPPLGHLKQKGTAMLPRTRTTPHDENAS
jgi:transcriptional regulator with XRE-family HTH domain